MSPQSCLVAGIVVIIVPTVEIGGASILSLLIADPAGINERRHGDFRTVHTPSCLERVSSEVRAGSL